jgi:hypothetical protein
MNGAGLEDGDEERVAIRCSTPTYACPSTEKGQESVPSR